MCVSLSNKAMLNHTHACLGFIFNHTHVKPKQTTPIKPYTHHTTQNQTTQQTNTCKHKPQNHQTQHQPNQPPHIFILKFKYKYMRWLVGLVLCLVVLWFVFTCVGLLCGLVLGCVVCVWLYWCGLFRLYMCMVKYEA
jgi:Flp pilus assembly protein TadB